MIRTFTLTGSWPPTRSKTPVCKTQQLRLQTERHIPDLVEEQSPVVGELKSADSSAVPPR